ncbi:MAG: cytochrome c [Myxococcota bacterium]
MRVILMTALALLVACDGDDKDTSSTGGDSGSSGNGETTRTEDILALTGDASSGAPVYTTNCQGCHAEDGSGTVGPALSGADGKVNTLTDEQIVDAILNGVGTMPAYEFLSDQEAADLLAYLKDAFSA